MAYDNANQQHISQHRVDLATAGLIHYGMHPDMLLRYMKGKYTGESRSADAILEKFSPYIEPEDARHIYRIITQGCPSQLIFEEDRMNKLAVIKKGNQQTFEAHPEVVEKTMNKKEKTATFYLADVGLFTFHLSFAAPHTECAKSMESTALSLILPLKPG